MDSLISYYQSEYPEASPFEVSMMARVIFFSDNYIDEIDRILSPSTVAETATVTV